MIIITYWSRQKYHSLANRTREICRQWGIPFKDYSPGWLTQQPEYPHHLNIFGAMKGAGYWAWKPLAILDALKDNDEVLYLDSSILPVNKERIMQVVDATDAVTVTNDPQWKQIQYCKRSAFVDMGCDSREYHYADCIQAGITYVKRRGTWIIEEWRDWCLNYDIISDKPSSVPNYPKFVAHRHDQSILGNLAVKYKNNIDRVGLTGELIDKQ